MEEKRVQIEVGGIVQGVFFRAETVNTATKLELKGWVKNLPNGNVKIVAEGTERKLTELYNWCKTGPKNAIVDSVNIKWESSRKEFSEFKIIN